MFVINADNNNQGVHWVNNIDFINVNTYYNMYLPAFSCTYSAPINGCYIYTPNCKWNIYGMDYNTIDEQQYYPNIVTCEDKTKWFYVCKCCHISAWNCFWANLCMISLKTFDGGEVVGKKIKPSRFMSYKGHCCNCSNFACANIMLWLLHTDGTIDTLYCKDCCLENNTDNVVCCLSDIGSVCETNWFTACEWDKLYLRFLWFVKLWYACWGVMSANYDTGEIGGFINSLNSNTRTSPVFQTSID